MSNPQIVHSEKMAEREVFNPKTAAMVQSLVDLFTDLNVKPWEMLDSYIGFKSGYDADRGFAFKDCIRAATAVIGATVAAEADGGVSRMSDARDYAVELFADTYTLFAESKNSMIHGSAETYKMLQSLYCARNFIACYGWEVLEGLAISSEEWSIIVDSWDKLGIPRNLHEGTKWVDDRKVIANILGKQFTEFGCLLYRDPEGRGYDGLGPYGYESDYVRDYINALIDAPISPIEVEDIVRSSIQEIVELEYLARSGRQGDPDKVEWRQGRIRTLIDGGFISRQRVDRIRSEVLRNYNPVQAHGPCVDHSISFGSSGNDADYEDGGIPF